MDRTKPPLGNRPMIRMMPHSHAPVIEHRQRALDLKLALFNTLDTLEYSLHYTLMQIAPWEWCRLALSLEENVFPSSPPLSLHVHCPSSPEAIVCISE